MEETAIAEYKEPTQTLALLAGSIVVKNFEQAMDAADLLLEIKELGAKITARKEQITKPLNNSLKSARALFKPFEEQCAEAENSVKDAILDYHERNWDKGKSTDNTINGLHGKVTVVERKIVVISDPSQIPAQFCSPDPEKIEHALKAGIAVPGAELINSYSIAASKI